MRLATPYVNNSSTVYLERLKTSTDAGVMMGLASIAGQLLEATVAVVNINNIMKNPSILEQKNY